MRKELFPIGPLTHALFWYYYRARELKRKLYAGTLGKKCMYKFKKNIYIYEQVRSISETHYLKMHKLNIMYIIIFYNSKVKGKNHLNILLDTERAFDKIMHYSIIWKNCDKLSTEWTYLKTIKLYKISHHSTSSSMEKDEGVVHKNNKIIIMSTLTACIQHNSGHLIRIHSL